ncbi:MAG: histidine triad nucleotide-binding protein [Clostridia bacterium]|nr:histidine triad nucleotide-binding protein [Clostridia bacterium]
MEDCLFCKIINGEIPSKKAYEDDDVYAFWDIAPTAPVHILVIPKNHIATLNDISEENSRVVSKIYEAIPKIAKENGIAEDGYRVVSNCNQAAGQTVFHIHFHLLGGRELTWPAG